MRRIRGAADRRLLELEAQIQFLEHAQGLRNDLGPDAVTGQNGDFHCRLSLEIPGELRFAPRLEGADLVRVAQRQADLV